MKNYWYAVLKNHDDKNWKNGSFDDVEAMMMCLEYPEGLIAVIDADFDEDGNPSKEPICIYERTQDEF